MLAIPLVTVCYIFINVAYFFVMTPQEIIDSPAVAVVTISFTVSLLCIQQGYILYTLGKTILDIIFMCPFSTLTDFR